MTESVGFPFVARPDARLLILGTLPGVESLKQHQYYAKKQNSFWRIMDQLCGASPDLPYEDRLRRLTARHIALWDVCAEAVREGSLDSAIRAPRANDFVSFFAAHSDIRRICFNGQPAAKLFDRLVTPFLPESVRALPRDILPSTSPAHAAMSFEQKLIHWHAAFARIDG